jgi:hypothetical protein
MVEKGLPRGAEETGEFRPGIRSGHIHDPDCFDPRLRRLNAEEARGLAALYTAPELALGSNNKMLVERISRALESAGVEFIDENGGGPGVRLRKRHQKKS